MKKKSKSIQNRIGTMHRKLDKLFQQKYKREMPISLLGGRTETIHHFILKVHSTHLRYHPNNFIPLTNAQHCLIHSKRAGTEAKIAFIKGKKWFDWITEHKKVKYNPKRDKFYLEQLKKLEKELISGGESPPFGE